MPNPNQQPLVLTKDPNKDIKDMDVLCTLKVQIESQILEFGCIKDHIQTKIKMQNPSQESPAPIKAPNQDLKDMDVLCTFKVKIESQNSKHGCIKDQWPHPNENKDAKPQSGTSSPHKSPKSGHKGHGCSLHPQFKIEPKFGTWLHQRPVTISELRSRCQSWVTSLQCPPMPKIWTSRTGMFFAL